MRFPLLALTASLAAAADVLGQALTPQIDQYIQQIVALEQIPGLTVGVSRLSGASEFGAWGYKSEDGDAMTTDTLFNIGSCSKAFLSAAMGILIDDFARGRNTVPLPHGVAKFDWDTKVAAILPGVWGLEDPWASQKTNIADLLSHVTGLPRHDYSYGPTDSTSTVLKKLQSLRPAFELREQWTYNNMMYMVGAHIISTYTGNYIKFVTDRIFTPLNMSSTTFSFNAANASGKATQTFTASGRRIPWWITDSEVELVAGPGGVISSVVDMDKWVKTMLNGGIDPRTNSTIIPASAWTEVTTSRAVLQGFVQKTRPQYSIEGYGLGWGRDSYAGHDIIEHDGAVPGSSSLLTMAQLDGVAVTVLVNTDDGGEITTRAITYEILDSILGITDDSGITTPPPPPAAKRALSHRPLSRHALSHRPVPRTTASTPVDVSPSRTFLGTYHNDGYGTVTLCDAASTSAYCTRVLGNFTALNGRPIPVKSSDLFAAFATIWSSHALLLPAGGTTYQLYPIYIFPEGYGKNSTPFQVSTGFGVATFVLDKGGAVVGFGLNGTVDNGPTDREKQGGSIEETADAWFVKV